jgi:hypothetical protein
MRPSDGFWGVGERLLLTEGNKALETTLKSFRWHSRLAPDVIALEHRRSDCNFQTALLFDFTAEYLGDATCKATADMILDYLFNRSSLLVTDKDSPVSGLWQFYQQQKVPSYWVDDNSWNIAIMLVLAKRGRPDLRRHAINAARTLNLFVTRYFDELDKPKEERATIGHISGLRLNPHWCGLATMALALASLEDHGTGYADTIARYYEKRALAGPSPDDECSVRAAAHGGLPWSLSEYAYLSIAAPVVARVTGLKTAAEVAQKAADILLGRQHDDGHFPSEHYETPASPRFADLVYTQNFASIGLQHCHNLLGDKKYEVAYRRSLEFLAKIQDSSDNPHLRGCWRGMYDTEKGTWGGGDEYEGGQSSVYSGWTNAPIATAFLFDSIGELPFLPRK